MTVNFVYYYIRLIYKFYTFYSKQVLIYSYGRYQTYFSSSIGDLLRIEKVGNKLYFKKNNITMRTYTIDPNVDYHIDGSFYHSGTYDVPIEASFPNPSVSYAIPKKKLDGSCTIVDGDLKFKFIQEYAVLAGQEIRCKVYDWQRNIVIQEDFTPDYGVNWFSIPTNNLNQDEIYILEFEGNKKQTYYLKFKYQINQDGWATAEDNSSSQQ